MKTTKEELEQKIKNNLEKFRITIENDEAFDKGITKDGIIDIDEYLTSSVKILWVLKEANSPNDDIKDERLALTTLKEDNKIHKDWQGTFAPIVLITYGILNNVSYDKALEEYNNANFDVIDSIKKTAYINVKKVAGGSKSLDEELYDFCKRYADLINEQIDIIDPDIIIFGGSMRYLDYSFQSRYSDQYENITKHLNTHYYADKLVLNTDHPNNRYKREDYCSPLIETATKWLKKRKQRI